MSRTELPLHSYDECNLHGKRHFNYMWSYWCRVYGRWNMSASLRPTHYENSVREHKNIKEIFFCRFMWIVMLWWWELIFKIPFGFKVVLVSKPAQLIEMFVARVFFLLRRNLISLVLNTQRRSSFIMLHHFELDRN